MYLAKWPVTLHSHSSLGRCAWKIAVREKKVRCRSETLTFHQFLAGSLWGWRGLHVHKSLQSGFRGFGVNLTPVIRSTFWTRTHTNRQGQVMENVTGVIVAEPSLQCYKSDFWKRAFPSLHSGFSEWYLVPVPFATWRADATKFKIKDSIFFTSLASKVLYLRVISTRSLTM